MRITKRRVVLAGSVILLLAAAAVFLVVGGVGESAVESYIATQLKKMVNDRIEPDLEFDTLDYQQPKTVVLHGVRLVSPDPDAPGKHVRIFEADEIHIELANIPRPGQPLVLESLTLEQPTVRLIVPRDGGAVVGYGNLVQQDPDPDADPTPLSEILQLRLIALREASVVLDTRGLDAEPTVIDEVTTDLHIDPSDGGRYQLALDLDRSPALELKLDAVLDIDHEHLEVELAEVDLRMAREQDRYLPQSVQTVIQPYDLTGDVTLTASGRLNLGSWQDSALTADLALDGVHGLLGSYRIASDRFEARAVMADRQVEVQRLGGTVFGGELRGDAVVQLGPGYPIDLRLGGTGLDLEQTLRPDGDNPPRYAGIAAFNLSANGPLTDIMREARGEGALQVRQGRIARIAVVSDLIDFMESAGDLSRPEDGAPAGRDHADVAFRLRGDHAYLSEAALVGSWFAVRGKGKVYFDQALNVQVNAGPMEKVQDTLGLVGDVFGALTDSLLAYRVTGTAADPTIRPVAFGGLRGAPGDDEEDLAPWVAPVPAPAESEDEGADEMGGQTPAEPETPVQPERRPDPRAVPDDAPYDS